MSRTPRSPTPVRPTVYLLPADVRRMNTATGVLLGVLAVLGLLLAGAWAVRQPLFDLSAVRVDGDTARNSAATLRANVMSKLSGNFFSVDMAQTRAAFEAVPWVRRAVVQREFPNRLHVVLQEHHPLARWGADGDAYLVNTFGEVFEVNQGDVDAQDLPLLSGPVGQATLVLQGYQKLSPVFEQLDAVLEALDLTEQGSWRAQLDSGAVVNLGHGSLDEIQARTRRFVDTFTQVSSRYGRPLESADLRYSTGYALKLRGVTTVSASDVKDNKVKR
ncbi:MAG: FtsQ-type POTRA domain-containing protein [Polaromonas sp.]|nr:FtsQ-type POTRA domain-containing protein [Polaromonas sp.]